MYRSLRSFVFLASLPGCIWAVATPEVSFTVHNQMQVPGETLPAGNYTLLFEENILQDRAIVRLKKREHPAAGGGSRFG